MRLLPQHLVATSGYFARIRLFRGLFSTSASPSSFITGGTYMAKRPRSPFFNPYQPPTGFSADRAHASTVPSATGFCSSALPSNTQSPCALSIARRSSRQRRWYRNSVFPTCTTRAGGSAFSSGTRPACSSWLSKLSCASTSQLCRGLPQPQPSGSPSSSVPSSFCSPSITAPHLGQAPPRSNPPAHLLRNPAPPRPPLTPSPLKIASQA
jgi:hypothetical protein